ncbi:hypothetical protein C8R48DRAFT_778469 [Suillus tomentosus]|nr:hypothetical protein C8R48DRAFT_778469 [Suillus tomentosus]
MSDWKASPSDPPSYLLSSSHNIYSHQQKESSGPPAAFLLASTYPSMSTPGGAGNQPSVWDTITLSSHSSPALSVEISAPFELGQMLGGGEVIGELQISWDELLDHGDEPFDIPFPPVFGVKPSLKLKAAIVHACDDQDDALFDLVLDQCPVSHPDHATALTNLARARLEGYIRNDVEDIDATTSLFRDALTLRPQPHPDHPLSLYNVTAAQLYHELLPLCPEVRITHAHAAARTARNDSETRESVFLDGCSAITTNTSLSAPAVVFGETCLRHRYIQSTSTSELLAVGIAIGAIRTVPGLPA